MEIGPDIGAPPAAGLADEPGLDVGEPDIIGPPVAADRRPMAAVIVAAIDQETANATGAHFAKDDLLGAAAHAAI
jgi:hypothetical protein